MYRLREERADERGQVGIGTLIVFIAMVLVAAIAAGVLINTAGFLQNSAEATGQESSDSTTNRVQVVSATGSHFQDGEVGVVSLTIKKAPGSGNVDLGQATVQWVGPSGSYYQLAESGASGDPDGRFGVSTVQDDDRSLPVLDSTEDRFTITLDLGDDDAGVVTGGNEFGEELAEGETATVRITTTSGATTVERIVVPKTLSGGSAVAV
ncbi:archaellin/type IV pilin N-terminal domain-containing protein [Haloarcula amylovorans]|uniref:archaellin/type IV pilin N-terminal domain-containing protein n=1 Tax=Haloarcula amylovorans TaxID=2562280 RepID=UPI001076290F|nr:archaellin/type IV pilin N-terminal domain-containing protein [Halomicroarcula amylolytica]